MLIDNIASRSYSSGALRLSVVLIALLALAPALAAQDTIIPQGASWKYLDDGSDQGTAWVGTGFDDSLWVSGAAQLGYGDGDETTVVSFGPDSNDKYTTTYFRHEVNIPDPSIYLGFVLRLLRDDGAVVHVNGTEAFRDNMPGGAIDYQTFASSTIGGAGEDVFTDFSLASTLFVPGPNHLAVEIHQRTLTSSDISFDMELIGVFDPSVNRGPYLQKGTPTSVTVRWRTDFATEGRVTYGTTQGSLNLTADDGSETDHSVTLTGLSPDTVYYYSVGTLSNVLEGDDADHFFLTSPPAASEKPTRIWVLGDSGTADANAEAVRDAYYQFAGSDHTDLWLMLGDNAYNSGLDGEYQAAVFDMYPEMLRKSVLWPTRGNHETSAPTYYGIFDMPTAAEAGGAPSGTEAYYSFDYANIHFICLDSHGTSRAVGGPMWNWCQGDISTTDQEWIIAFWHHPPYTRGSHNSDSETNLKQMRENFLPMLEDNGVDLVLGGHSHSFERSFLIDGHYDVANTFDEPTMLLDGGDGSENGDGAYWKVDEPNDGAVYVVAGSSGKIGGGPLDHPAMHTSLNVLGSLVLDIDGDRLDARFLNSGQSVQDDFTIQRLGSAFCFGDGSGMGCPCGNIGSLGEGCAHSAFILGMKISASGTTSIANDDFTLTATQCPPNNNGIFYTGTVSLEPGNHLFDGLQCVGGNVRRFQGVTQSTGTVSDTGFVAQEGTGTYFQPGSTYNFQYWSRDVAAGMTPCGNNANFSPGFSVTMTP